MRNLGRPVAVIVATVLVAITPLFAYADAGKKDQTSVNDLAVLNQVESIMKGTDFSDLSHGGIVSAANADFDKLSTDKTLLKDLGLDTGEKLTRGRLISIIARTAAKGKAGADTNKADTSDKGDTSDENGGGQGKGNKGNHGKPDTVTTGASTTADETATATPVPTQTAVPTATMTPTPVATEATATETPTATATPETHGRSGDAPGHSR